MKKYAKLLFVLGVLLIFHNCKKDDDVINNTGELNEHITSLSPVPQDEISEADSTATDAISFDQDSIIYACETTTIQKSPGYNELLFAQTYKDALYPGALLNGESVINGTYTLCNLPRKPITITVDLPLEGDISATIDDPKYSTIQTEINNILSQDLSGSAGAEVNYTIHRINTEAQLKAEIGLNCSLKGIFEIGGNVNFNSGLEYNRVAVKFCQNYYNIIVDQPTEPMQFIDNSNLSDDEVRDKLGTYSPMYVSTVTYGRMALIYFESTDLSFDLEAGVKASFPIMVDGGNINLGGEGSFGAKFKRSEITCKAFILGGSGENACTSLTTTEAITDFIKNGGEYSKESPGKPISYSLRYLANNDPVKVVMNCEYTSTECRKINMSNCHYRITLERSQVDNKWLQTNIRGDLYLKACTGDSCKNLLKLKFTVPPLNFVSYGLRESKTEGWEVEHDFGRLTKEEMNTCYLEWYAPNLQMSPTLIPWKDLRPISTKVYLKDLLTDVESNLKLDNTYGRFFIYYTAEIID